MIVAKLPGQTHGRLTLSACAPSPGWQSQAGAREEVSRIFSILSSCLFPVRFWKNSQIERGSPLSVGLLAMHMTDYFLNVPSQKFPVPKITKQTKSHSLNFNVLSSVIDSSGEEV